MGGDKNNIFARFVVVDKLKMSELEGIVIFLILFVKKEARTSKTNGRGTATKEKSTSQSGLISC